MLKLICKKIFTILCSACWIICHALLLSTESFSKHSFRNTNRVSKGLDADQDRHSVEPGYNGFKLFAKVISRRQKSPLAKVTTSMQN